MDKIIEDARIIYQERISGQIFRLRLHSPEIAGAARCGQFVMIRVREGTDPLLRRPFSFSRIYPEEGDFEILYRVVGPRHVAHVAACAGIGGKPYRPSGKRI